MEAVQPTLAEQLAVPLVLLICTSIIALVGWLLSRQLTAIETAIKEHETRLDVLDHSMWRVTTHLWPSKGPPSPYRTIRPPNEDSA